MFKSTLKTVEIKEQKFDGSKLSDVLLFNSEMYCNVTLSKIHFELAGDGKSIIIINILFKHKRITLETTLASYVSHLQALTVVIFEMYHLIKTFQKLETQKREAHPLLYVYHIYIYKERERDREMDR